MCPTSTSQELTAAARVRSSPRARSLHSIYRLALGLLGEAADEGHPAYLTWDHPSVPPRLRAGELPAGEPLILLDEIHQYARWRNLLKGIYDTEKSRRKILVTGSARLDYYRKG